MRVTGLLFAALVLWGSGAAAQTATDVFLVDIVRQGGTLEVQSVTRVTDRDGYDNQPRFTLDGLAILYTSIDAAGQADIRGYEIASGTHTSVTRTAPESEYSATPVPGGRFTAIRVEADSAQRLWSFALDGSDARVVLPAVAPVGYHAWLGADTLALFVLGDPATLVLTSLSTGDTRTVARNIGRSLHRIPGRRAFSYVQRTEDGGRIRALDPETGRSEDLIDEVADNEFHAWLPDGTLISATGTMLVQWRPGDGGWRPAADLAGHGIRGITRIAVSPDGARLAVVGAR